MDRRRTPAKPARRWRVDVPSVQESALEEFGQHALVRESRSQDLPDIAALPRITDLLIQRGYSDSALRMILGENMMRVIGEVVG